MLDGPHDNIRLSHSAELKWNNINEELKNMKLIRKCKVSVERRKLFDNCFNVK